MISKDSSTSLQKKDNGPYTELVQFLHSPNPYPFYISQPRENCSTTVPQKLSSNEVLKYKYFPLIFST